MGKRESGRERESGRGWIVRERKCVWEREIEREREGCRESA